ncbi:MAG: class A beta-lactamase-related serine hydrolase, partial [Candidatus Eremiobacteraeota bacterium]|nr:class A beta-lactamase-related serine hydrolase [Candidatus Eremiobacteraeota bacterium]
PGPLARLQTTLSRLSNRAPGRVAMQVRDLTTGYTSSINANASMPAASTIKIPVMVEVFRQMELGKFDLNTPVKVSWRDKDCGSGDLCYARSGSSLPVSRLLSDMITVSDNTAANMLIRLVGRSSINDTMVGLGLRHTRLTDYIHTAGWNVRRTLRTSPADMVNLLTEMAQDRLVDEWSSKQMVAILERQEINTLLPAPLPAMLIAHKTGSFDDTLNDVGIVYAYGSPYVIAVMTTRLPTLSAGRRYIRGVSNLAYHGLQQFAQWREQNGAASTSEPDVTTPAADASTWEPSQTPAPEPTESPSPGAK